MKDKSESTETYRKRVEDALQESELRYRTLFESVPIGIGVATLDGEVLSCNEAMLQMTGYSEEEIRQINARDIYQNPEARELLLKQLATDGFVSDYEVVLKRKDGTPYYANLTTTLFTLGGEAVLLTVTVDITERKRMEEKIKEYTENLEKLVGEQTKALKESEEKLKAILTGIGDLITIQNKELDIIWVNQPIRDLWGDVIGKKCYEVYKRLDVPCPECTVETVFNEEKTVVTERLSILPDGSTIQILTTSSPVHDAEGNVVAVVEVIKDITERKQLESQLKEYTENLEKLVEERTEALRESEEKFKAILTGIGDQITIQNKDLDIIWVNQTIRDLWGDVIGKKCYEAYKGLTAPCPECTVETVLNKEKTIVSERTSILPNGRHIQILVTSSPVRDAEGNIVAVVEVSKDITERKRIQKALKLDEERLEALLTLSQMKEVSEKELTDFALEECVRLTQSKAGYLHFFSEDQKTLRLYSWSKEVLKECTAEKTPHYPLEEAGVWADCVRLRKPVIHNDYQNLPDKKGYPEGHFPIKRHMSIPVFDGAKIVAVAGVGNKEEPYDQSDVRQLSLFMNGMWEILKRKQLERQLEEYTENLEKMVKERTLKLKESEERYRGLYESSIDGIASFDMEQHLLECNQAFADMLGYTKEELSKLTTWDLVPNKWPDKIIQIFNEQTIPRGYSDVYEVEGIKKDGTIFPVSVRSWLIKDEEGNPAGRWSIVRDITERKKAEKALNESEKKYRSLYISMNEGVALHKIIYDEQGEAVDYILIDVNPAYELITGLKREKVVGSKASELYGTGKAPYLDMYAKVATTGQPTSFETYFPPMDKHFSISVFSPRKGQFATVFTDITERKKAEEELHESQRKLSTLMSNLPGMAYRCRNDLDWTMEVVSEGCLGLTGYQPSDLIMSQKLSYGQLIHKEDREIVWNSVQASLQEKQPFMLVYRIINASGEEKWVWEQGRGVFSPTGDCLALEGFITDITERKKAEEKIREYAENLEKMVEERTVALRESEELYRTLVKTSPDAVTVTDLEGRITDLSQRTLELHGFESAEELLGRSAFELIAPEDHEEAMINLQTTLKEGVTRNMEYSLIRKDGSRFIGELNAALIKDAYGNPEAFMATTRDITERKRLEEMKERFISITSHELRTPLISIKGYVDYLLTEDPESIAGLIEPSLEVVRRNTDRLLHLTDDLLDIQRIKAERLSLELEPLNLIELTNHCAEEIRPFLNKKKQNFHLEVPDGPLLIQGDIIRLSQVIMNLLSNATKFTPESGDITLSVEEKEDIIQIQVSDTGIGIRKEDLDRVFQPFTKIEKPTYVKGTGLGLSIAKGLVEAHGGKIWAHSDGEGKGATFTITLPKRKVKEVS